MKAVSFVAAASGSGKTTLIERIIPLLKARGLRVAVIKHAHRGFELDREGTDSWRFREAGADAVVLAGPDRTALLRSSERTPALPELQSLVPDADLVILEGFKQTAPNRIEVFRPAAPGSVPLCRQDASIRAVVSEVPIDVDIPRFDPTDVAPLVAFILDKL